MCSLQALLRQGVKGGLMPPPREERPLPWLVFPAKKVSRKVRQGYSIEHDGHCRLLGSLGRRTPSVQKGRSGMKRSADQAKCTATTLASQPRRTQSGLPSEHRTMGSRWLGRCEGSTWQTHNPKCYRVQHSRQRSIRDGCGEVGKSQGRAREDGG